MSQGYLERILNHLVEAELIQSRKGPGGGFLLARPIKDITVRQVFRASGEELLTAPCLYDDCESECPLSSTCPARDVWSGLRNVADEYLEGRTLAEFCDPSFRAGGEKKNGLRPLRSSAGS